MNIVKINLKSASPIQFSRHHQTPKLEKENDEDFEKRTWLNKAHINEDGRVIIPASFFKNSLSEIAKYLSVKIPGKGKSTYTKHFEAGVMVLDPLLTNRMKTDLTPREVFGSSQGVRGAGKRVLKIFPTLESWEGSINYIILDETITEDILLEHVIECGKFQGLGTWRPRNGGTYGRFDVVMRK